MKTIYKFLVLSLFTNLSILASAQAPGKFNYQAIIRDGSGKALVNQNVEIRFQIFDALFSGNLVYQEDFTNLNSGSFGVINVQIGNNGNVSLKNINWNSKNHYVMIQLKQSGVFTDISSSRTQLVSVPYTLFSDKCDTAKYAMASNVLPVNITGEGITTVSGSYPNYTITSTEVDGSTNNELQTLGNTTGNVISLSQNGGSVTLNFTVSNNQLQLNGVNVLPISSLVPAGTIVAFGGTSIPDGWLLCDGTSYQASAYSNLFSSIGKSYGGSGNNFNVPDFRGRFLRGLDGNAGNDPDKSSRITSANGGNSGNTIGSLQKDAIQGHWHQTENASSTATSNVNGGPFRQTYGDATYSTIRVMDAVTDGKNGTPRLSSETRPANIYVNYIIKY